MKDLVTGLSEAKPYRSSTGDSTTALTSPDQAPDLARCAWGASTTDYAAYHDHEWGRATDEERTLFEKLCLEGFQSGLSWLTILRKRQAFRAAFADFEAERVATFGADDVERLLGDAGIVRHRGKIEAAINNARALVDLWDSGERLADLIWSFETPRSGGVASLAEIPALTPESTALSKALKKRGFRFVGPTTAYAAMQAMGVANDHLAGCWVRSQCEDARLSLGRRYVTEA